MTRKILSKEELMNLNGELVYIAGLNTDDITVFLQNDFEKHKEPALVFVQDERVYLLNSTISGSAPQNFNFEKSIFNRSYSYDEDILCTEMYEDEKDIYIERIKIYSTLNGGEDLYCDGQFGKAKHLPSHGITFSGESLLTLNTDFFPVNFDEVESYFKGILDSKTITEKERANIVKSIKGKGNPKNYLPSLPYRGIGVSTSLNKLTFDGFYNNLTDLYDINIETRIFKDTIKTVRNYSEETLTAVLDKRFIISKSFNSTIKSVDQNVYDYLSRGENNTGMQFISLDSEQKVIKFLPKKKNLVLDKDIITEKNFQSTKPHKFFTAALKGFMSEYDIKKFVDTLLTYKDPYVIKYFRGKKIAENYSKLNTREWATTSCMDRKAENFFELYTDKKFRLGVIFRDKEQVGRFLEVTTDEGFVYNDRVYYKDEETLAWYNRWVDAKGLTRKKDNTYTNKTQFYNIKKGSFTKNVTVTLSKKLEKIRIYPYLDTLTYGRDNKLTNYHDNKITYTFTNTNGKCERNNMVLDVITNEYIHNNYAVRIDFGQHAGRSTTVENLVYSSINGGHCLK